MNGEVTELMIKADEACQSFLKRFNDTTPPEKFEHELMPILDCMAQVARAIMGQGQPQGVSGLVELAHGLIIHDGQQAVARVMLDPFKKLQLIITDLCPVHGPACPGSKSMPPRNTTLKELRLIGFSGVVIVRCLHDFLHSTLVDTMVTMPGPKEVC